MSLPLTSDPSPSFLLDPSSPNRGLLTDPPFLPSAPDQPPSSFYMVRIISKAPHGAAPGFPHRHTSTGSAQGERGPTHSPIYEPWSADRLLLLSTPGPVEGGAPRPISCAAPGSSHSVRGPLLHVHTRWEGVITVSPHRLCRTWAVKSCRLPTGFKARSQHPR